jgi:hypothetical protein
VVLCGHNRPTRPNELSPMLGGAWRTPRARLPLQPLSANALNFIRDKRSQLKQHQRMPSRRLRQPHSRWRQEAGLSRHNEKPVDIEKKAIDTASYKLYYVNYEIRSQNSFHSSSLTKGLTNAAFCPIEPLARH